MSSQAIVIVPAGRQWYNKPVSLLTFYVKGKLTSCIQYLPGGSVVNNPPDNAGDVASIPGLGGFPGEGNGNTPVFLPGKSHGQRSLLGYSP